MSRGNRACRRGCHEDATRRLLPWKFSLVAPVCRQVPELYASSDYDDRISGRCSRRLHHVAYIRQAGYKSLTAIITTLYSDGATISGHEVDWSFSSDLCRVFASKEKGVGLINASAYRSTGRYRSHPTRQLILTLTLTLLTPTDPRFITLNPNLSLFWDIN